MNFDIRGAVINNIHNMNNQELQDLIEDSVKGDEKLLPGLGVLFEVIWENSTHDLQREMVGTLREHLSKKS